MEILGKLFGSDSRVKIMRHFLMSPDHIFTKEEIWKKTRVKKDSALKEINILRRVGFLVDEKIKILPNSKKVFPGFKINNSFIYLDSLRELLLGSEILKGDDLLKKFRGIGKIKLIITAGIFINNENSPADLLVVGDDIKRKSLVNIIKVIESEIGKEIKYGVLDTEDFKYRLTVYDKFVREILDFPHNKILDKLSE
jgi:hypothetical protein